MGYDWGMGKSQRAVLAEENGLMTATQLGKSLRVSARAVKLVLAPVEWHHTSKMYNKTDYYDPSEVTEEDLAKMKSLDAEDRKAKKAQPVTERCHVEYVEWRGRRKTQLLLENVDVDFLPNSEFVLIHTSTGVMRKNRFSRWIRITPVEVWDGPHVI